MLTTEPRVTEGTLETADGRLLPLEWTKVEAKIHGPLATVKVRQKFRNPSSDALEATYLFPLPHQASVFAMEFRLGDRVVKGVVKEKEEARRAYAAARSQGRAATLLEQERPNLFTLSVANIAPQCGIEVVLEYQELVAFDDGEWRFVFPMLASDRYHSGAPTGETSSATTEVADGHRIRPPRARRKDRISPISLTIAIEGVPGLEAPQSTSHPIQVSQSTAGYEIQLDDPKTVPNRDFVMTWRSPSAGLRPEVWFERDEYKPGTFCVRLPAPKVPTERAPEASAAGKGIHCGNCGAHLERREAIEELQGFGMAWSCDYCGVFHPIEALTAKPKDSGKDVVFLLDLSGSMKSLEAVPQVILQSLSRMGENDAFRIIKFHHQLKPMSEEWLPCNGAYQQRASDFLSDLRPHGGTEIETALRAAAQGLRRDRTRVVVLITDGAIGNEGRLLRELPKWLAGARLYVLGLGPSVNRYLIDKMALHGRGAFDVAAGNEPAVLTRFSRRVAEAGPVLSDLSITWADGAGMEIYPRGALDLFSGQSIRVTGRFVGNGPARLIVTAKTPNGLPFRQELTVDMPESTTDKKIGLERIWARQRIDDLLDQLTRRPEQLSEVRLEVLGLALKHQLMSPYTALVAEDSERSVDAATPRRQVEVELAEPQTFEREPVETKRSTMFGGPASAPMRGSLSSRSKPVLGRSSPPVPCSEPDFGKMSEFAVEPVSDSDLMLSSSEALFDDAGDGHFEEDPFGSGGDSEASGALFDIAGEAENDDEGWLGGTEAELACEPTSDFDDLFGVECASPSGSPPPDEDIPVPLESFPPDLFDSPAEAKPSLGRSRPSYGAMKRPGLAPKAGDARPFLSTPLLKKATPPLLARKPGVSRRHFSGQQQVSQSPPHLPPRVTYSPDELARARELVKGRLDLVFLIDETGSMGSYIGQVQRHLLNLIRALKQSPLCQELRLGLVTYRDHPPQDRSFVTRVVPLTENVEEISQGVARMHADGGGDGPEAVTDGLHELLCLDWHPDAARLVVMVGDAPPHGVEPSGDGFPDGCPCGRHWYTQAEGCREMGITVHTVGCQGIHSYTGAVAVFESVAKTTGGLFVALSEAELLIGLISGLADRELDRERVAQYVRQVFEQHRSALEQADPEEQVRFITETLQARSVEVLDLNQGMPGRGLVFRPLATEDIQLALGAVLRRQPMSV